MLDSITEELAKTGANAPSEIKAAVSNVLQPHANKEGNIVNG